MQVKIKIVKKAQLEENKLAAEVQRTQIVAEVRRFKAPRTEAESRTAWSRLFGSDDAKKEDDSNA